MRDIKVCDGLCKTIHSEQKLLFQMENRTADGQAGPVEI